MLARKALRALQLPNVFKGISMNPKIELTSVMQALKVAEHLRARQGIAESVFHGNRYGIPGKRAAS
jgi:hypothetical protein